MTLAAPALTKSTNGLQRLASFYSKRSFSEYTPEIELVHRLVINIRGDGLDISVQRAVELLLITNVMLCPRQNLILQSSATITYLDAGNHVLALHALDSLGRQDAREVRIGRRALPVTTALDDGPRRADDGSEHDVDALASVFAAEGDAALTRKVLVPAVYFVYLARVSIHADSERGLLTSRRRRCRW